MSATKTHTHATHHTSTEQAPSLTPDTQTLTPTQMLTQTPSPTPAQAQSLAPAPAIFVTPPPAGLTMPVPPSNYTPATPGEFKTVVPRQSELAALSRAVSDLRAFTNYQSVLGTAAPAYTQVLEAFDVGQQWSVMRQGSEAWDGYAALQEGLSWRTIRMQMDSLRPTFELAATADPTLLTKYTGLASLLGAKKSIAQKGVSTRKANAKATAEGKPAIHGVVGKKRQLKAAKAALAAQPTPPPGGTVAPSPAPVDAPAPSPAPAPATSAPKPAPATAGTNGATS